PSKVDIHKLKDGGYSLGELRNLIDTFKANSENVFYPTAHAKIDPTQLQKKAEEKLSDFKKFKTEHRYRQVQLHRSSNYRKLH
ncbi:hypothetical protein LCGC14_2622050, partial [marine sediment metagenome]